MSFFSAATRAIGSSCVRVVKPQLTFRFLVCYISCIGKKAPTHYLFLSTILVVRQFPTQRISDNSVAA